MTGHSRLVYLLVLVNNLMTRALMMSPPHIFVWLQDCIIVNSGTVNLEQGFHE